MSEESARAPQQGGEPPAAPSWRRVVALLLLGLVGCGAVAAFGYLVFPDPFSAAGQTLPLAVAGVVALALAGLVWGARDTLADVGALLVAGWISWFGASQLHGTPFPHGGMQADIARLTALATKFSAHVWSTDVLVKGLPSEYPPLFPWLVGRAAALADVPAWKLIGVLSVVFCGVAVLVGYLLWRCLVGPATALALCLLPAAVYGDPRKAHEVAALCLLTPWALGALGRFGRQTPPLHWAVAGLAGGLLVTDYQGYLVFCVVGLLVVVGLGLRPAPRWPYVRHLLLTVVTAVLVAGWYLGPWLAILLRTGGDDSADLFVPFEIARDPWHLPWQHPWPIAGWLTSGLVLLVGLARRADWARYLLALALAAMGYRWVMLYRYDRTGHTAFLHYTDRLYDGILAIGAVLAVVALWPRLVAVLSRLGPRLHQRTQRGAGALGVVCVAMTSMGFSWDAHRAGHPDDPHTPNFTRLAHATELPGGGFPRFNAAAGQIRRFPAVEVQRIIEGAYGRGAVPTVLSYQESLSSYYPYYQYLGVGGYSANSLAFWPRREAEVRRLSLVDDPAEFARQAAHMEHGAIDVLVLRRVGDRYLWRDISFRRSQFPGQHFRTTQAFGDTWVFTRVGAEVDHVDYPR